MEIERILEHSNKLYSYIHQNLFLKENVDFFIAKIGGMKKAKGVLKEKFMINSVKNIHSGIKKKNLINTHALINTIQEIKIILDKLKDLSNIERDNSKSETDTELIEKGKNLIRKLKSNQKFPNLKIIKSLEEEFSNYTSKSTEKIVNNFTLLLKEEMNKLIHIKSIPISSEEGEDVKLKELSYYVSYILYNFSK